MKTKEECTACRFASSNLFVSALENDGEGAMADQVLGVVLEFANALHRHRDVTTT